MPNVKKNNEVLNNDRRGIIDNDDLQDKRNYEELSNDRHIKSAIMEKPIFLPSISTNDRSLPFYKSMASSRCESKAGNTTLQLPSITTQHDIEAKKNKVDAVTVAERDDTNQIVSNNIEIIQQKRSLEASLKESLRAFQEPKCYLDGETRSTRHLMLEINEFYIEMAEQLRLLKGNLLNNAQKRIKEVDEESNISSYEIEVKKLVKSIEEDDKKVEENIRVLEEIKQDRSAEDERIKYEIYEQPGDEDVLLAEESNSEAVANNSKKNKKTIQCDGKNFVAKNRELAKDYNTSRHCLTQEEERKLQSLLSDIDPEEENMDQHNQLEKHDANEVNKITGEEEEKPFHDENGDDQNNVFKCSNRFKFEPDEMELLNNLDVQINNLQQVEIQNQISDKVDNYDDLKRAENEGKHWKFQLLQKRLKHVERKLAAIQVEKEKENADEDESKDLQAENRINIEEEYNRSVHDISIDMGEIEYEMNKETETQLN